MDKVQNTWFFELYILQHSDDTAVELITLSIKFIFQWSPSNDMADRTEWNVGENAASDVHAGKTCIALMTATFEVRMSHKHG
jgi:hypothetical protein